MSAKKTEGHEEGEDRTTAPVGPAIAVSGQLADLLANCNIMMAHAQQITANAMANNRYAGDVDVAFRYMALSIEAVKTSHQSVATLLDSLKTKDGKLAKLDGNLLASVSGVAGSVQTNEMGKSAGNSRLGGLLNATPPKA
jgi:hypothetical protein